MSLNNFLFFHLRKHVKNPGFMLYHSSRRLETDDSTWPMALYPRLFSVSGTRDEIFALFFDILLQLGKLMFEGRDVTKITYK